MRARLTAALAAAALAGCLSPAASACAFSAIEVYVTPPPGLSKAQERRFQEKEREKAYKRMDEDRAREKAAKEVRLWDEAETVLIARVEQRKDHLAGRIDYPGSLLRPIRWLKGSSSSDDFHVYATDGGDCGHQPDWYAIGAQPGREFVVFVRGGAPAQTTVMDTLWPSQIVEPRIRAALGATRPN